MEKETKSVGEEISLRVPVKIGYSVLQTYLQKKLTGEHIKKEKKSGKVTNYAEIRDIELFRSAKPEFDLAVAVTFKILAPLFRNRKGKIVLDASLEFDGDEQEIRVRDYRLQGDSGNWILDTSLEALANTFLQKKLRNKMKFQIGPHIEKLMNVANTKLEEQPEVSAGICVSGKLRNLEITGIKAGASYLMITVGLKGCDASVEVNEIPL